jgi:hypothetical protein
MAIRPLHLGSGVSRTAELNSGILSGGPFTQRSRGLARSIVLELQELAQDGSVPVDELLRRALVVATKLGVKDFRDWVNRELNGYSDADPPPYRRVSAQLHVRNPRVGLQRFTLGEADEVFETMPLRMGIKNLVQIASSTEGVPMMPIDGQLLETLLRAQGSYPMEPVLVINQTQVAMAVDAVRNAVLDWSLRLESEGILGEGMTFTREEKAKAVTNPNIHIGGNFQGFIGSADGSTVSQNLSMNVTAGDFNSLSQSLSSVGITGEELVALHAALKADPKPASVQSFGEKTKEWIGKVLAKAVGGGLTIGVEKAATMIPQLIATYHGLT